MAKKAEQNRVMHNNSGVAVEQTSIYDDSLLPPAEELEKLQRIDSGCIDWIKSRTEKEQDARINFNFSRLGLAKDDMKNRKQIQLLGIIMIFIVIIVGFALSAFFLWKGQNLAGTIFGGADFVALIMVLNRVTATTPKS